MSPTPEDWKSLEELYHQALDLPAGQRCAFLKDACPDENLRREVESLLACASQDDPLLKNSPWGQEREIGPGAQLGPYLIGDRIGAGGMGEVYKARDTRLQRDLAIKILPAHMMGDVERRARFIREAQAASRLNHPNVVTVYDIGEDNGRVFIAMENIDGKSLDAVIPATGLPIAEVFKYAIPIAAAFAKAHASGIIHRDLKPGNIMIAKDGCAKVLDFGLAKLMEEPAKSGGSAQQLETQSGVFMGTPAFMSPEQAEGKTVDPRSDIFSFGAVLYQMTTGKRAFTGNSIEAVITAVLQKETGPLDERVPGNLRRIIVRCLKKDPERRFQSMADVRVCLEELREETLEPGRYAAPGPERGLMRRLTLRNVALVAAVLASAVAVGWRAARDFRQSPEIPTVQFQIEPPPDNRFTNINASSAISPDGRLLVFAARASDAAKPRLWLRPLESSETRPLAGTEDGNMPFWSPDGKSLAFFTNDKLKRIDDLTGAPPITLCDAPDPDGGSWNGDGFILFSSDGGLHRIPASGGVAVKVIERDASRHEIILSFPQFLPDGKHFLYSVLSQDPNAQGTYVTSLDHPSQRQRLLATNFKSIYVAPRNGHPGALLWVRGRGELVAQTFDAGSFRLTGDAVPVAGNLTIGAGRNRVAFWASDSGVLAYRSNARSLQRLVWMSRDGKRLGDALAPAGFSWFALSPDGKKVAFDQSPGTDLWVYEFSRKVMNRVTFDPRVDHHHPVWSPNGTELVFASTQTGVQQIYRKDVDGTKEAEQLTSSPGDKVPSSWSRDGRYLLYIHQSPNTGWDLWLLPMAGDHKPIALLRGPFNEMQGVLSPDGKWLAYQSDESGRGEVYVQAFTGTSLLPAKVQVSNHGGARPYWPHGNEILYEAPTENGRIALMSAATRVGNRGIEAEAPRELFNTPFVNVNVASWASASGLTRESAVSDDGQLLLVEEPASTVSEVLTVVVNWQTALKQ